MILIGASWQRKSINWFRDGDDQWIKLWGPGRRDTLTAYSCILAGLITGLKILQIILHKVVI